MSAKMSAAVCMTIIEKIRDNVTARFNRKNGVLSGEMPNAAQKATPDDGGSEWAGPNRSASRSIFALGQNPRRARDPLQND